MENEPSFEPMNFADVWGVHMCDRVDPLTLFPYFFGDKLINPIVGVYIPIIMIPIFQVG